MDAFKVKLAIGILASTFAFANAASAQATIDLSGWNAYAQNLTYCLSGSYSLIDPSQLATMQQNLSQMPAGPMEQATLSLIQQTRSTYNIRGWEGNLCHVTITQTSTAPIQPSVMQSSSSVMQSTADSTDINNTGNANNNNDNTTDNTSVPPPPTPPTITHTTDCYFSSDNVATLAKSAQIIGSGGYNSEIANSTAKIINESCKVLPPTSAHFNKRKLT